MTKIYRCIYHDWSKKGDGNKRHDCFRGDVRFVDETGKIISRLRKRFKCPIQAKAWVDGFQI